MLKGSFVVSFMKYRASYSPSIVTYLCTEHMNKEYSWQRHSGTGPVSRGKISKCGDVIVTLFAFVIQSTFW